MDLGGVTAERFGVLAVRSPSDMAKPGMAVKNCHLPSGLIKWLQINSRTELMASGGKGKRELWQNAPDSVCLDMRKK